METSFLRELPVAHRGLHDGALPENGIGAFRAAIAAGYAIETDVRLSADHKLVVFHDDSLLRMTGANLDVYDCTAEELSRLRLAGTQEHIPLFEEFLSEVNGRTPLLIEIKNMPQVDKKAFIQAVARALEGYDGIFAIQSFVPSYVKLFKKLRPDVPCGILAGAGFCKRDLGNSPFWRIKACVLKNMSLSKNADFISYAFRDYPNKATERYKGTKLAWTVRSPEDEAYARKYADNIIFENYIPEK